MGVLAVWDRGEGMQAKGQSGDGFEECSGLIFKGDVKIRQQKNTYVNGLVKTMTCKIINKLVWWGEVANTGHCQPLSPLGI